MASEKISKKDLQKQVARLQGKIEKITTRLKQQQSEISSTHEQIQQLEGHDRPGIELGTLDRRQRELNDIIEGALARLNEHEQTNARMRQSAQALQTHTQALEKAVADANRQGDELLQRITELEEHTQALPPALQRLDRLQSEMQLLLGARRQPEGGTQHDLDELRARTDGVEQQLRQLADSQQALEAQTSRLSRETEHDAAPTLIPAALSDRVTALGEELQGLQASKLERRLDELEQALSAGRDHTGTATQTDEALKQQLGSVAGITADLGQRVDTLITGSQQLGQLLEDVNAEVRTAGTKAQQQQGQLKAHEERLREQQRLIDAAAVDIDEISSDQKRRLDALEESRQALQQTTDSLGVQQTRQDHTTGNLQKSLKRRSLGGLLLVLLVAGVLGVLLFRGISALQVSQQAMQAEITGLQATQQTMAAEIAAGDEVRSGVSGLEGTVTAVRQQVTRLDAAVAQATRQLAQVNAADLPQLSEQVDRLNRDVETLGRESRQRSEAYAELQREQQQLKAEVSGISTAVGEATARFAEVATQIDALNSGLAERSDAPRVSQAKAAEQWVAAQKARHYTLQIGGFHQPQSLSLFVEQHRIGDNSIVYHTEHQGQKWYVLFYGRYQTIEQALAARRELPPDLAAHRPWVRRIPSDGDFHPL